MVQTEGLWIRWYNATNNWIPTLEERAEQEHKRAERLAQRLRAMGVDPDSL